MGGCWSDTLTGIYANIQCPDIPVFNKFKFLTAFSFKFFSNSYIYLSQNLLIVLVLYNDAYCDRTCDVMVKCWSDAYTCTCTLSEYNTQTFNMSKIWPAFVSLYILNNCFINLSYFLFRWQLLQQNHRWFWRMLAWYFAWGLRMNTVARQFSLQRVQVVDCIFQKCKLMHLNVKNLFI